MKYRKRLNNNVVIAADETGEEKVLFGRGLGFAVTIGGDVDMDRVERVFVLKESSKALLNNVQTTEIPREYIDAAHEIFAYAASKISTKLSDSVIMPLADHIHIASQRYRQNFQIKNMMLEETRRFYHEEYRVGKYAVELLNRRFDLALTDDEAGFIALHIVNAELGAAANAENLSKITSIIHDIENIVRMHYLSDIDIDSNSYRRFMTHLKFFAERIFQKCAPAASNIAAMLPAINETYPEAAQCVERINGFLAGRYHHVLSDDERLYLTIHVAHIMTSSG